MSWKHNFDWDFITWICAIWIVALIVGGSAEALDWLDRRDCRLGGGRVEVEGAEWRCVGGAVQR